jgi:hypothetical protein
MTFSSTVASLKPVDTISRRDVAKVVEALQELGHVPADFASDRLFMRSLTQVTD